MQKRSKINFLDLFYAIKGVIQLAKRAIKPAKIVIQPTNQNIDPSLYAR